CGSSVPTGRRSTSERRLSATSATLFLSSRSVWGSCGPAGILRSRAGTTSWPAPTSSIPPSRRFLRPHDRPIGSPVLGDVARDAGAFGIDESGRLVLVDVDAQTGPVVGVEVAL